MKQHIEIDQMLKLDIINLAKLLKLQESIVKNVVDRREDGYYRNEIINYSYKLNIGYLIDFIEENGRLLFMSFHYFESNRAVIRLSFPNKTGGLEYGFANKELCDALWEAVVAFFDETDLSSLFE